ncbi:hypothetical protein Pmani_006355 [Petrolisthes manimaculis]|uniref:Uncharacterized protein n=1 Tax=Petrolisthes manimaculis TaxID=1843537 RepID=A0AAE1QAF5_9EUCA|nr:hypothetical protein Pmani_006355 [Petrolisthes manimaculis]
MIENCKNMKVLGRKEGRKNLHHYLTCRKHIKADMKLEKEEAAKQRNKEKEKKIGNEGCTVWSPNALNFCSITSIKLRMTPITFTRVPTTSQYNNEL